MLKLSTKTGEDQSYLTYLRRYTYSSIVGVVACDDDDDGEAAIGRGAQKAVAKP
jgi:hypothetical protein